MGKPTTGNATTTLELTSSATVSYKYLLARTLGFASHTPVYWLAKDWNDVYDTTDQPADSAYLFTYTSRHERILQKYQTVHMKKVEF